MSRSRRKTPVKGITTASSEKQDKRLANRRLRRKTKEQLDQHVSDDTPLPAQREVSNRWAMDKDGKLRFDEDEYPKGMRK